jgi:hypothetical protein
VFLFCDMAQFVIGMAYFVIFFFSLNDIIRTTISIKWENLL